MWCAGWVPNDWTGEPDSPRVGPGPHTYHNHSCRPTGSGETGLSYPDSNWMADSTRAVLRARGHTTPATDVSGTCDNEHTQDMGPKPWQAGYPLGYCWDQDQGLQHYVVSRKDLMSGMDGQGETHHLGRKGWRMGLAWPPPYTHSVHAVHARGGGNLVTGISTAVHLCPPHSTLNPKLASGSLPKLPQS